MPLAVGAWLTPLQLVLSCRN